MKRSNITARPSRAFGASYKDDERTVCSALADLAVVLRCTGDEQRLAEVRVAAEKLLTRDSPDWERWLYAGTLYAELDQFDAAESCFAEALQLNPNREGTSYNLACAQLAAGHEQEFRVSCDKLVDEIDPRSYGNINVISIANMPGAPKFDASRLLPIASSLVREDPTNVNSLTALGGASTGSVFSRRPAATLPRPWSWPTTSLPWRPIFLRWRSSDWDTQPKHKEPPRKLCNQLQGGNQRVSRTCFWIGASVLRCGSFRAKPQQH